MAFRGITFEVGACVLTETDPDGYLTAQPDGRGPEPRLEPYELHHAFGFAARPVDPVVGADGNVIQGQACNLLFGSIGNENHAWLAADPRYVTMFPPLAKGSSVQYCAKPSFDTHSGADGTKTIYVEVGDSAHLVTIGLDGNGDSIVEVVHADGMAITMLKGKLVIKNNAGDAYLELGASGFILNGNVKINGACEINGLTVTPTGDVKTLTGVSLASHLHPTAMGPTSSPTPTP